jgi:hypothetical protein
MPATPPSISKNAALTPTQTRVRAALAEALILALLGFALLYTNRMFTFIDDETNMLGPAAQPTAAFLSSLGTLMRGHEHPPLYDLLLHVWLRLTGGAMDWLRVPSVVFFVAGLFCLSRAARLLAGIEAGTALLWLGLLWPYGFHFGRLAGWYSFVFLLISALTWAYLRHSAVLLSQQSPAVCRAAWIRVCLLGLALVYANYVGWALLFLLAVDDWLRHRAQPGTLKRLLVTAAVFVVAYIPLWPAFWSELSVGTSFHQSWTYRLENLAYNVYVLFVSESVGPWFWRLGIPAAIASVACLLLAFFGLRGPARRFLVFGAILIVAMAFVGILYPRRLFVVAPWFLLPIAAAIGVVENRYWRGAIALCLGLVAATGWFGVSNRRYYATPRFFEPWEIVAQDAAETVRNGGLVIGNNPSFFFYLTYALQVPPSDSRWRFSGVLPEGVTHPQVWEPEAWQAAGRPLHPLVFWVRGMPGPEQGTPMAAAAEWLDTHCPGGTVHYLARDPSYQSKQKFAPQIDQLLWRIETHLYACEPSPPAPAGNTPGPGTP